MTLTSPYSPITDRAPLRWPGDARLALWVVPNIEHYQYLPPASRQNPWPRMPHPDVGAYGVRDYGNRIGFWRLMPLLDAYGLRPTLSLNLGVYRLFPEIKDYCERRDYDVMCHGQYNTDRLADMTASEQLAYIAGCQRDFEVMTGRRFQGWFSPANSATADCSAVAEAGLDYIVDYFHDDQPTLLAEGRIVCLPYSMDLNDGWNFRYGHEASDFVREAIDQFDQLYSEGNRQGRVMCLPLHPFVFGQPHRIGELRRLFDHILSYDDVWHATGSEIADWFRQSQEGER